MNTTDLDHRYSRQETILPRQRLDAVSAAVVGIGAVGRQLALQLAAVGVPKLQLVDFDTVEAVNLAPQGYLESDLGQSKVSATAALCRRINSQIEITESPERFRTSMPVGQVLFSAVDSIETRRRIWRSAGRRAGLFIDTRMGVEVVRVLAVAEEAAGRHYAGSLFPSAEAYAGPCTAKSTIYMANIAAGLAVAQFAKWLRGLPLEADVAFNLLTCELTTA